MIAPDAPQSQAPADAPACAVHVSAATLARATAFLGAGQSGPFGARVVANALRELDRFLSLLIDDVASRSVPGGLDHAGLTRQRNTPNKLRGLRAALGLDSPDHERLRAIGRSRDRLFHSAAPVRGVDTAQVPGWLQAGGLGHERVAGAALAHQNCLAAELRAVCRFYDRLAAELLAACDIPLTAH